MNKIKELRNRKGLSQRELGKMIGVAHTVILSYEKGICDPSTENLIKMADIFGVSVDTLVGHDAKLIDMEALDENRRQAINKIVYELDDLAVAKLIGYMDK